MSDARSKNAHAPSTDSSSGATDADQILTDDELAQLHAHIEAKRERLGTVVGRMALLEDLVRHFKSRYPTTWRFLLERLLRARYPELAQDLLALLAAWEEYEYQMSEQHDMLVQLSAEERRKRLWEIRHAAYGKDAEELFAEVRRAEAVGDVLDEIDESREGTLRDRFDQYLTAVRDNYEEDSSQFMDARRQEVVDRFLSLESVQSELASLEARDRYRTLRTMREAAGMDEAALARWDELDRLRDQRWEKGEVYMKARAEAEATLQGEALEARLADLRDKAFGPEAEVIENEEAGGYFRFREQRTYGQN